MSQPEHFEILILGSGQGAKLLAWDIAIGGRQTAVVERRWVGGSCPNVACMPSKNEIWSARVAYLAHHAGQFGTVSGPVATDMARVGSASATWSTAKSSFIWRTTSRPASN
jgi:pyruvate/2-oxoglutarate dehydrogenase complex dihydrolipoamide dehydrogenase (E3) component